MARASKPWWWGQRGRWATTIDGRRELAPATIGKGDEHEAWAWHRRLTRAAGTRPGWDAGAVCDAWVAWDAGRVAAGVRAARPHRSARTALRRACGATVGGVRFSSLPAAGVTPGHLEALLRALASEERTTARGRKVRPASPGNRRYIAKVVKQVFAWASTTTPDRPPLIAADPLAGARLPPCPAAAARHASRGEAAAWLRWLWRSGHRDLARLQRCLIHTGARPQELADVTWRDLDWRAHRDPAGHWLAVATLTRWKCSGKTGRLRRVYFPGRLVRMLRRLHAGAEDRTGLVWRTVTGLQWDGTALALATKRRRDAAIRAGLDFQDTGPDRLVNYRWRHTAATTLIQGGVDIATVAELLGTSVQMLTRTYVHLLSGHVADAASRLASRRNP